MIDFVTETLQVVKDSIPDECEVSIFCLYHRSTSTYYKGTSSKQFLDVLDNLPKDIREYEELHSNECV